MTHRSLQSLLRRTAAIGVIVAPFLFSPAASALQITLTNASGNNCTYDGTLTVSPAGDVTVNCQSSQTSGPGTFSVSGVTSMTAPTAPATSNWTVNVLRSGGTTGAVTVDYTVSGAVCASAGPTTLSFADGSGTAQSVVTAITGAGTCTLTLTSPTGGAALGSSTVTVNATASTGGTGNNGVPIVAGCATPDATTTMGTLPPFLGVPIFPTKPSGAVTSYPLLAIPAGKYLGQIAFGTSPKAFSPSNYSLDYSITPCPGVITPPASSSDYCNMANYVQQNGGTFSWVNNSNYANIFKLCLVPNGTQYYFNVRWKYSSCSSNAPTCGFSITTNTN